MSGHFGGGIVFWLKFAAWCQARARTLASQDQLESVRLISEEFGISRSTAYRWLAAWREVHPTIEGATS